MVAIGILCSRLTGLVRQRVFAHYFGLQTDAADAFSAAFRIPNLLQNLFGEGALSASFIPVYAALLARGERPQADRVARAVGSLLAVVVSAIVLVGVLVPPLLIAAIAPGFAGDKRDLTIAIVRILFPGAGLLAMSAWCLGVLNSHHRFLLSYTAPVMWNAAMIATLLWYGPQTPLPRLAAILAWGSVVGSALQLGVQVPSMLRVAPGLAARRGPPDAETTRHVRVVVRNFMPVFFSRGVVQISAYVDTLLASLLPTGAVTGLMNAQLLYTLPVSLFGMSVSAAELPAMSGAFGADPSGAEAVRRRLDAGLRQIAFFVVPSAVAFLALGDIVAAAVLQTGRFTHADALYVWAILAGSAIGLLPSTLGRLYASTYFALRDTRTPLKYAIVRVTLGMLLGYVFAIPLPRWLGISPAWGVAGLTASGGLVGWLEMLLLRQTLNRSIGATGLQWDYIAKLWSAAIAGALVAWAVKLAAVPLHPILTAIVVLGPYGVVFVAVTFALRIPEASNSLSWRFRAR
ncbi:MAG: murein biosynthesis integral membrane protein MurJ [Acidobacteria bacterium]|nr:murein biosynthesis integral membrane protein MurJ [Acidobacteriota bacterium]